MNRTVIAVAVILPALLIGGAVYLWQEKKAEVGRNNLKQDATKFKVEFAEILVSKSSLDETQQKPEKKPDARKLKENYVVPQIAASDRVIINLSTWLPVGKVESESVARIYATQFKGEAKILAVYGGKDIWLWDVETGAFKDHLAGGWPVFSQEGSLLAFSSPEMKVVETNSLKELESTQSPSVPVSFSPDNKRIAYMPSERKMAIMDLSSGKVLSECNVGWNCGLYDAKFIDNERVIVAVNHSSCTGSRIFDLNQCKELGYIHVCDPPEPSTEFVLSSGGNFLITASEYDRVVHFYKTKDLEKLNTIKMEKKDYLGFSFSSDVSFVSSRSWSNEKESIEIWKFPSGQLVRNIEFESSIESRSNLDQSWKFIARYYFNQGRVDIRSLEDNSLLCWIVLRPPEWMVFTPDRLFDASAGARKYIFWKTGDKPHQSDKIWDEHYRAGALSSAFGKIFAAEVLDAARSGDYKKLKQILANDLDSVNIKNEMNVTPLHQAVAGNDKTVCEFLIEKGADVDAGDTLGETPLIWATYKADKEIVELLLKNGADPNHYTKGRFNPLTYAAEEGHTQIIELLISYGSSVNSLSGSNDGGWHPLDRAVRFGHKEAVLLLIEKGADVNLQNCRGMTALHWAVEFNRLEMVELLVDQGANVNTKTDVSEPGMNNGETPLQLAIRLGHKEIADYLRKHGAVE